MCFSKFYQISGSSNKPRHRYYYNSTILMNCYRLNPNDTIFPYTYRSLHQEGNTIQMLGMGLSHFSWFISHFCALRVIPALLPSSCDQLECFLPGSRLSGLLRSSRFHSGSTMFSSVTPTDFRLLSSCNACSYLGSDTHFYNRIIAAGHRSLLE